MRLGLSLCLVVLLRIAQTWRRALYPAAMFATYLAGSSIAVM